MLSCLVNIDWYFFGKEEFKITVVRNIIIKIITILSIFILIRKPCDIVWYTFIMAFSTFLSQFSLWIKLKKEIKFKISFNKCVLKHLKPIIILFIPSLAMSIYHIMDKTMLGIFSTYEEVGYYYNADKIINIPLRILIGVSTVMLSRTAFLTGNNKKDESIQLLKKSINIFTCISCAMSFGVVAISRDFIPFFFGNGYDKCIILVNLLSIVMIIKTLSSIMRSQYLIPFKKENIFVISVVIGAITNLFVNYIMFEILKLGALGAVIGTIVAELIACIIQIIMIQKNISIIKDIFKALQYLVCGIFMSVIVYFASSILIKLSINIVLRLIIEILIGIMTYFLVTFIFWKVSKNDEILKIIKDTLKKFKLKVIKNGS